jgi:hypothetical protein
MEANGVHCVNGFNACALKWVDGYFLQHFIYRKPWSTRGLTGTVVLNLIYDKPMSTRGLTVTVVLEYIYNKPWSTRGLTATGVLNYIPTQKPRLFPLVHRYIHTLVHHSAVSASADATRISTSAHNHISTLKNP